MMHLVDLSGIARMLDEAADGVQESMVKTARHWTP